MNLGVSSIMEFGMALISEQHAIYRARMNQIIDRYDESKSYPRKLKKKVRKQISLDWSINEYFGKLIMVNEFPL